MNLLNVGKVLLLAKQAQVHAEKTCGAGIEVTQIYTKKPEMSPITYAGSLCKIHAVLCSKIADVHGIEVRDLRTWKFVSFRKIFRFLYNTRNVTKGERGHNSAGAESLRGAEKSQKCHNTCFNQDICFRNTTGSNMGAPNLFLAPGAI